MLLHSIQSERLKSSTNTVTCTFHSPPRHRLLQNLSSTANTSTNLTKTRDHHISISIQPCPRRCLEGSVAGVYRKSDIMIRMLRLEARVPRKKQFRQDISEVNMRSAVSPAALYAARCSLPLCLSLLDPVTKARTNPCVIAWRMAFPPGEGLKFEA